MGKAIAIGDEAPDFDLTSTEDVVLMLRDEVPRSAILLYFFGDPAGEAVRRDLAALAAARDDLARRRVRILGISPAKVEELKDVQRELYLPFPLLQDDRGFARFYGVPAASEDEEPGPAVFLVDRRQRVRWMANPASSAEDVLAGLEKALEGTASPTDQYPKSIVNTLVDRWVN